MFKPNIIDRLYHMLYVKTRKYKAHSKLKKLNNKDFTIISNNCWGGYYI